MIYWHMKHLPEFAHVPAGERNLLWLRFVCTRPVAPEWYSRFAASIIIVMTSIGFGTGVIAFYDSSPLVTLACGLAGILAGALPGFIVHLSIINSLPVRRALAAFIRHAQL